MTKRIPTRSSAGFPAGCREGVLASASRRKNRISIPLPSKATSSSSPSSSRRCSSSPWPSPRPRSPNPSGVTRNWKPSTAACNTAAPSSSTTASSHAYPPSIDALVQTNNIRFLRKKYVDPMTGKDDWKPILFGQNKAPTAMGFFGQPLAGTTIAGTGPGGGNTPGGTGGSILPGGMGFLTGGSPSDPSSTNPSSGSTGRPQQPKREQH